jgi:hypothetical protein
MFQSTIVSTAMLGRMGGEDKASGTCKIDHWPIVNDTALNAIYRCRRRKFRERAPRLNDEGDFIGYQDRLLRTG